jgi:cyclic beta-1,2-glucan synthetase
MRVFTNPTRRRRRFICLSNGRYHVVISSAGGGYSRWRDLAVTRWREDATRDCWGTFVYLRDLATGRILVHRLSTHPARDERLRSHLHAGARGVSPASCRPRNPHRDQRVAGRRRGVAAHHDHQPFPVARVIELTSYAEVVLALPAADAAHPAFSNLFVQTEFARKSSALLCTRRARSQGKTAVAAASDGGAGRRTGRNLLRNRPRPVCRARRTLANPAAMQGISPLSNTVGSVLDPIISLRRTSRCRPMKPPSLTWSWA